MAHYSSTYLGFTIWQDWDESTKRWNITLLDENMRICRSGCSTKSKCSVGAFIRAINTANAIIEARKTPLELMRDAADAIDAKQAERFAA